MAAWANLWSPYERRVSNWTRTRTSTFAESIALDFPDRSRGRVRLFDQRENRERARGGDRTKKGGTRHYGGPEWSGERSLGHAGSRRGHRGEGSLRGHRRTTRTRRPQIRYHLATTDVICMRVSPLRHGLDERKKRKKKMKKKRKSRGKGKECIPSHSGVPAYPRLIPQLP